MLLVACDPRYFLRLDLLPLIIPAHRGWHSYRLAAGRSDRRMSAVLESDEATHLFLQCSPEPEILVLCNGLVRVSRHGGAFRFTPIDEGEFILELFGRNGELTLRVDATDRPFDKDLGWPDALAVNPASVVRFAEGLRLEFASLPRF